MKMHLISTGKAIEFELYGKEFDELRSAAAELRVALQGYNGVLDASDTFRAGKQEVQLTLLPEARNLGLTLNDLGQQVRQAFAEQSGVLVGLVIRPERRVAVLAAVGFAGVTGCGCAAA